MPERQKVFGMKKILGKGMNEKDGREDLEPENEKSPKTRAIGTKKGLDSTWLLC